MRRLWIIRIGAGAKARTFLLKAYGNVQKNDIQLNRKMLAELAARDFEAFKTIVKTFLNFENITQDKKAPLRRLFY